MDKPFFVHIPKNMGNFIYQKYYDIKKEDKNKFYGFYDSIVEYYKTYKFPYIIENNNNYKSISIDHLTPHELLNLGIMKPSESSKYIFFAIMREPLDRFISLCNYWDVPPNQLIYNITKINLLKQTAYNLFQHLRPQNDYINDIKRVTNKYRIFSMNKKNQIRDFLATYFPNKSVNFEEKVYHSRDKYNTSMLSRENMNFINKYYKDDFQLFRQL